MWGKHFLFLIMNFLSPMQSTGLSEFVSPSLLSEGGALNKMEVGEMTH